MDTIMEKKYKLAKLEGQIKTKKQERDSIMEKVKDATDEATIKSLDDTFNTVKGDLETLNTDFKAIEAEIAGDEEAADTLASEEQKMAQSKKSNQAVDAKNYLKTKAAMDDYVEVLRKNAGQDKDIINKAWEENLKSKGITNSELLLPEPVVTAIVDAFQKSGTILSTFRRITGVTVWANAFNTSEDTAKGHKDGKDKKEQGITLAQRTLACDFVYKYIQIPKKLIKESGSVIIKYVLEELPMHVVRMVEKAAVIGDGLPDNDDDKITSFIAIAKDEEQYNTNVYLGTDGSETYDAMMDASGEIEAEGTQTLVMHNKTYTHLKKAKDADGRYLDPTAINFGGEKSFGGIQVITVDWMPKYSEAKDGEVVAVLYVGQSYVVIGDAAIDSYENFILQKNRQEYLAELYTGGGLMDYKSAATILKGNAPSGAK